MTTEATQLFTSHPESVGDHHWMRIRNTMPAEEGCRRRSSTTQSECNTEGIKRLKDPDRVPTGIYIHKVTLEHVLMLRLSGAENWDPRQLTPGTSLDTNPQRD